MEEHSTASMMESMRISCFGEGVKLSLSQSREKELKSFHSGEVRAHGAWNGSDWLFSILLQRKAFIYRHEKPSG